jgi:hypothetical protein
MYRSKAAFWMFFNVTISLLPVLKNSPLQSPYGRLMNRSKPKILKEIFFNEQGSTEFLNAFIDLIL